MTNCSSTLVATSAEFQVDPRSVGNQKQIVAGIEKINQAGKEDNFDA